MIGNSMLLIRNPRAGSYKAQNSFIEAAALIFKSDYKAYLYSTQYPGDAARIVAEQGSDYDVVVCFGGDGTLNEVINGLMHLENKPVLGYIPAGTTNDFAAGLGLSRNVLDAANDVLTGVCVPLDIGLFNNNRYFAYVASFGSFTKASYSAPQDFKNIIGYPAYLIEGIKSLADIRAYELNVDVNGTLYDGEYLFGGISNSTSMGGIIKLDERIVDMSDGLFEVMLVQNPKNFAQLQKLLHSVATKNYANCEQIVFLKSNKITLHCEKPFSWTIDGEFGGVLKDVLLENCKNAITVIRPDNKEYTDA